jgi:hypothetical protein
MTPKMRLHKLQYSLVFLFFLFFSCATNKSIDQAATERFNSIVKASTASGKIYRDLELLLSASATCLTPELRKVFVEKYAQDNFLSPAEKEKKAKEEQRKADKGLEFIVSVFSDQEAWDNLADEDSIWTVVLTDKAGHTIKPTKIYQLDPVPVYVSGFFPGMTRWKKVYSVIFPGEMTDTGSSMVLNDARNYTFDFRSAIGHLSLTF